MKIADVTPLRGYTLLVRATDGRAGEFDLSPFLDSPAFSPLRSPQEFDGVRNGGYFLEWPCGADLSADTIEAHWRVVARTGSTGRV